MPALTAAMWASLVAQLVKNQPAMTESWVQSRGWEDPLEKGPATHSRILAWRIPWTVTQTLSKVSAYNVGDLGSIPGSVRSPGEGNGNPLQYSCLENSMDGGAWQATVRGVAESETTERLQCQMSWSMGSQSVGHDWGTFTSQRYS